MWIHYRRHLVSISVVTFREMRERDGHTQSKHREREQRLVYPAHHYASILVPLVVVARVGKSARAPPAEQSEAYGPDSAERAIQNYVEVRVETAAAV